MNKQHNYRRETKGAGGGSQSARVNCWDLENECGRSAVVPQVGIDSIPMTDGVRAINDFTSPRCHVYLLHKVVLIFFVPNRKKRVFMRKLAITQLVKIWTK